MLQWPGSATVRIGRKWHFPKPPHIRKHLAFSTEEERFQALTERLDLFQQEGLRNDATLPAKDWLEDQPLQVRVEWGVALAAGSQLRALGDQVDCIVAQLRGSRHEESLDNSLEKLDDLENSGAAARPGRGRGLRQ